MKNDSVAGTFSVLTASTILLLCGMLLGMRLAAMASKGHSTSLQMGMSHAFLVLTALALLGYREFTDGHDRLLASATVLLGLTATGGVLLFFLRNPKQSQPMILVTLHALLATVALGLILTVLFAH